MTTAGEPAERTLRATLAVAEVPFGPEDADSIHAVGRALFERGDHTDAVHVFRLLALVAPTSPRSWTALASYHDVLGDVERARALYGLALGVPDHDEFRPFAAANKARLDLDAGDAEAAECALESVDNDCVESAELERLLVSVRSRLGRAS